MPVISPDKKEMDAVRPSLDALFKTVKDKGLKTDTEMVARAFEFAARAHGEQTRSSGEPYILHPMAVAKILANLKLDTATIVTGILHDTVEDTTVTLDDIRKQFNPDIAALVDGVTKISKITFQTTEEKQAENFRKMVMAMAKDLRVILVKLADRLHNMRTLQHLAPAKQAKIAQETLDIYSPLANRLGLSSVKRELEDLGLRYTHPEIYYKLVAQIAKNRAEREKYIHDVRTLIESALRDHSFQDAKVTGRPKHFFSIHKKMQRNNLSFDELYDVTGFRLLVGSVEQCYGVLGLLHSLWTPVPGRFKDYIAIPKANFYQSLHTTVVGPGGEHIEIQIRTKEMHETAERGIAAHWAYKEQNISTNEKDKFAWLNRLVESNKDLSDPNEFLETVKLDLFAEEVYVFTPNGEIKEFPQGATPLDFAYAVHTDVGNHCIGARINGRMVPLKHKLKSGDTVEILTSANQRPHKDWLKIVKTSRAKNKIRVFIKAEEFEKSLAMGELILEKQLRRESLKLKELRKDGSLDTVAEQFTYKSADDLLSAIGYGKLSAKKIVSRLLPGEEAPKKPAKKKAKEKVAPMDQIYQQAQRQSTVRNAIKVKGVEDLLVRFARCCNPVPGDPVVGFITRGRGISVHVRKCPKIFDSDPHRLIDIDWDMKEKGLRKVKVRIVCEDRPGLLADMSKEIRDLKANISHAQVGTTRNQKAVCLFSISIQDINHLKKILSKLEAVDGVIKAQRVQRKES